jgi:hypothetical protein
MLEFYLGDLRTGRVYGQVSPVDGSWDDQINTDSTQSVTLDLNDPEIAAKNVRTLSTPAMTFLAVVSGEHVLAAGPIWTRSYTGDDRKLTINARGIKSYYDHRLILPSIAATAHVEDWTIPDPDPEKTDSESRVSNPQLDTIYRGISLDAIAKRLVRQAHTWTGGNPPVVIEPESPARNGGNERTYLGVDFKGVGEALDQLMDVENGPEIRFIPRWKNEDHQFIEWVMNTGTAAEPLLVGNSVPHWDMSIDEPVAFGLSVDEGADVYGSLAWLTGGGQNDDTLVSRTYDPYNVKLGSLLFELVDTSHSTISERSTLNEYGRRMVAAGRYTTAQWSFTVEAWPMTETETPIARGPQLEQYRSGDICAVTLADWDPINDRGDPYYQEGGTLPMRIVSKAGNLSEEITITCAPFEVA